jgi:hypothetical protein
LRLEGVDFAFINEHRYRKTIQVVKQGFKMKQIHVKCVPRNEVLLWMVHFYVHKILSSILVALIRPHHGFYPNQVSIFEWIMYQRGDITLRTLPINPLCRSSIIKIQSMTNCSDASRGGYS